MLNTKPQNKQLFVKNNKTETNPGDQDTELNKVTIYDNVKKPSHATLKLDIPEGNVKEPDKDKQKICSKEWRWRIINIDKKTYVEMSYYEPKKDKRFFMSGKTNSWEEQYIDPYYDKYVTEEYYYYT